MKTNYLFKISRLIQIAALSAGLTLTSSAFAIEHSYIIDLNSKKVTDLGSLDRGNTGATAINDAGQVVGYSDIYVPVTGSSIGYPLPHAFITGPNGVGMSDLGTWGGRYSQATGINAAGQVTGLFAAAEGETAFITSYGGANMINLGTLGGRYSVASDINATGQVVGVSETSVYGRAHAFITGPNGKGMTDLGTLSGGYSEATGTNAAGQVTGYSESPSGNKRAFIAGPDGAGMVDLGTLGGDSSEAFGINDAGHVVGEARTTEGENHAFMTGPKGQGMIDLGTLGGSKSFAFGINDIGQVVGWSETRDGSEHAFVTGPNGVGMIDLNSVVSLPAGVVLNQAAAINNIGQVVASDYSSSIPPIPEPASYVLTIAGLGLVHFMARRQKKDQK